MARAISPGWGHATALLHRTTQRLASVDILLALALVGFIVGVQRLDAEWSAPARAAVEINLSPWALPKYTLLSLSRGLLAYTLSLGFTLVYGFWAAKSALAERVLIPLLDVLQSIPVLGFMPGLVLAMVAAFPRSNTGLELAAVIMIFTGQAWNMTFSFYHSLRSVPNDQREVATAYHFTWWKRLVWVELPFSTIGLVWNSMMSMAGGWFFLMVSEAFVLGDKDFRLPGLGSYMSVAVSRGDGAAMGWAVLAMALMIVILDQLLWRPVVVWAQKFRVEEGGQDTADRSWVLDLLRRSRLLKAAGGALGRAFASKKPRPRVQAEPGAPPAKRVSGALSAALFFGLVLAMGLGMVRLALVLRGVGATAWLRLIGAGLTTLGRRPRDRSLAATLARLAARRPSRRVVPRADALPARHRPAQGGRCTSRLGEHRAHAARHPVVHPVQRHRRSLGDPFGSPRGRAHVPPRDVRALPRALSPGRLPAPRDRMGHRGRGSLECEHRLGVRDGEGARPRDVGTRRADQRGRIERRLPAARGERRRHVGARRGVQPSRLAPPQSPGRDSLLSQQMSPHA
jgi:ABC-type nitrate/sulfonate/bicarbonate transport system permease component